MTMLSKYLHVCIPEYLDTQSEKSCTFSSVTLGHFPSDPLDYFHLTIFNMFFQLFYLYHFSLLIIYFYGYDHETKK